MRSMLRTPLRAATSFVAGAALATGVLALASAPARAATFQGTVADEQVRGTVEADLFVLREGRDVARTRGGDDLVQAGSGRDEVRAGAGADRVHGGAGRDFVAPGPGADRVWLGDGDDEAYLEPDGERDVVRCGAGDDVVVLLDELEVHDVLVDCERVELLFILA